MSFFERQEEARRRTRRLLGLFALATLAIAAAVGYAVACLVWNLASSPLPLPRGLPPREWLESHLALLGTSGLAVLAWISGQSLLESRRLRGGGGVVARRLGGVLVSGDDHDPERRRLKDVVEEMAIASGLPVPEVYLLPEERGINAFAAGLTVSDAAIAVTQGCALRLGRAELQGVIAHEFSHILNGDMRLNTRLLGALHGILSIAVAGSELRVRGSSRPSSLVGARNRVAVPGWLFAMALSGIGTLGVFVARLIQAAVSRERELLADSSAVQFTRDPEGLIGALRKIAGLQQGSWLGSRRSEAVSHMLFAAGRRGTASWFATHPPLRTRIRALSPSVSEPELQRALLPSSLLRSIAAEPLAGALPAAAARRLAPQEVVQSIGRPDLDKLEWAQSWLGGLPKPLREAAASGDGAPQMLCALLLSKREETRARQLELVALRLGSQASASVRELAREIESALPDPRLPLIDLALPALRGRARAENRGLQALVQAMILADGRADLLESALGLRLQTALEDAVPGSRPGDSPRRTRPSRRTLSERRPEVQRLLARLAHAGAADPEAAAAAYAAGVARLPRADWLGYRPPQGGCESLGRDLRRLDDLAAPHKQRAVAAVAAAILHDRRVSPCEAELLGAICALLHSPRPALVTSGAGSQRGLG